jgi:serine/threonine protein kinase
MGAVWRGTDHTLGREVALKRVGSAPGGADVDVRRAEREARLAARLNHPHVVAVFDLVDDGDQQWMVMELVEGTNLSQIVKTNGALPPDQVAPILAQVADALAAAHTAGIVHRDVKPSNILVSPDGNVKLTDFGIARTEADAALTQTGLVTGSPAYLAPEVATGRSATEASDMWSFGATLCHALTGRPPYEASDNVMGALYRIVNDEPPRPTSAGWLAPLLAATMVKDPALRWPASQARDFLEAGPVEAATRTTTLETVAPPVPQPVPQPDAVPPGVIPFQRRASRWPAIVLTVVVVLGITAVAFLVGFLDDKPGSAGDPGASNSSDSSSPPTTDGPTARAMETFIRDYLDLVVSDPEAAFEQLTPVFQEESGGLSRYLEFWGNVTSTRVESVSADPESLVVTYSYTRHEKGGGKPIPDDVSLQLELGDDGGLLIAGEA